MQLISASYGLFGWINKSLAAVLFTPVMAVAEPLSILALGDSLTQGYGLPAQQGFVPQLQGWLAIEGQQVEVINGGVSGDTTTGGLARIAWSLSSKPDALIVALGGNDLLRGIDPAISRRNLAGIMEAAQNADVPVLLVGIGVPNNYGLAYKQAFEGTYLALAQRYSTLFVADFLAALKDTSDLKIGLLPQFMQADGLHPNSAGVQKIVDTLGPSVLALIALAKQKRAPFKMPAK